MGNCSTKTETHKNPDQTRTVKPESTSSKLARILHILEKRTETDSSRVSPHDSKTRGDRGTSRSKIFAAAEAELTEKEAPRAEQRKPPADPLEQLSTKQIAPVKADLDFATHSPAVRPERVAFVADNTVSQSTSRSGVMSATIDAKAQEPTRQLLQDYSIGSKLGRGHFAEVRECTNLATGEKFALKMIRKSKTKKENHDMMEEIEVLRKLGRHDHLVGLVDFYEDKRGLYLVLDLCTGGDLFHAVSEKGRFNERMAARCCKQLIQGLLHMHKNGVVHRDLKPENILLSNQEVGAPIRITDFGLSAMLRDRYSSMQTVCGTWAYCAPEILNQQPYDSTVDVWSVGVVLFIMLSGYHPFDEYGDLPEPKLFANIKNVNYAFADPGWEVISREAKELIKKLLRFDPRTRPSLEMLAQEPWIRYESVIPHPVAPVPSLAEVQARKTIGAPLGETVDKKEPGFLSAFDPNKKLRAVVLAKLASKRMKLFLANRRRDSSLNSGAYGSKSSTASGYGSGANPWQCLTPRAANGSSVKAHRTLSLTGGIFGPGAGGSHGPTQGARRPVHLQKLCIVSGTDSAPTGVLPTVEQKVSAIKKADMMPVTEAKQSPGSPDRNRPIVLSTIPGGSPVATRRPARSPLNITRRVA